MLRIERKYVLAALILVLSLLITIPIKNGAKNTSADIETDNSFVIIIDAGHGGIDGGAVGSAGTVEKRINLEIALKLRDVLDDAGYTVIMTRCEDISIHDSSANTIKQKKVSDMHNRLALTRMYPNSLLVSIHQNTLGNSSVRGAQVFFSPNNEQSSLLAQCLQDSFNTKLQPDNKKETKKTGKNLYLFYNAQNVAILAECGFLSNPDEERKLCSEEYQNKIVYCLYYGILDYLSSTAN